MSLVVSVVQLAHYFARRVFIALVIIKSAKAEKPREVIVRAVELQADMKCLTTKHICPDEIADFRREAQQWRLSCIPFSAVRETS